MEQKEMRLDFVNSVFKKTLVFNIEGLLKAPSDVHGLLDETDPIIANFKYAIEMDLEKEKEHLRLGSKQTDALTIYLHGTRVIVGHVIYHHGQWIILNGRGQV